MGLTRVEYSSMATIEVLCPKCSTAVYRHGRRRVGKRGIAVEDVITVFS
jgi:hypothetical protein